jgi:hypothetical protein
MRRHCMIVGVRHVASVESRELGVSLGQEKRNTRTFTYYTYSR